jgi:HTH-type transcriptional regulator/antitoxin HipB
MDNYSIQTADQLAPIIAGFRKTAGLTQADMAMRLGTTQQTYSAAERNASSMSLSKLLSVLNVLGIEIVLRPKNSSAEATTSSMKSAQW